MYSSCQQRSLLHNFKASYFLEYIRTVHRPVQWEVLPESMSISSENYSRPLLCVSIYSLDLPFGLCLYSLRLDTFGLDYWAVYFGLWTLLCWNKPPEMEPHPSLESWVLHSNGVVCCSENIFTPTKGFTGRNSILSGLYHGVDTVFCTYVTYFVKQPWVFIKAYIMNKHWVNY